MKEAEDHTVKDRDIELLIGSLLRLGVLLSLLVVVVGGAIYLWRHAHSSIDYSVFKGEPLFTRNLPEMLKAIGEIKGRAIIQFGILLLIGTPIARILLTIVGFFFEKDYLYVGIAMLVLIIIIVSMLGGFGG